MDAPSGAGRFRQGVCSRCTLHAARVPWPPRCPARRGTAGRGQPPPQRHDGQRGSDYAAGKACAARHHWQHSPRAGQTGGLRGRLGSSRAPAPTLPDLHHVHAARDHLAPGTCAAAVPWASQAASSRMTWTRETRRPRMVLGGGGAGGSRDAAPSRVRRAARQKAGCRKTWCVSWRRCASWSASSRCRRPTHGSGSKAFMRRHSGAAPSAVELVRFFCICVFLFLSGVRCDAALFAERAAFVVVARRAYRHQIWGLTPGVYY